MCGIAGFVRLAPGGPERETLERMGQALRHRGPDAGGVYFDGRTGLCHRRLSIIDLSDAANQPMYSSSGRYVIVFNGEIYNFRELRRALQAEGRTFRTDSDTEVLLALYETYGAGCVSQLNGMFAFAIWDTKEHELFLARDRLGKKPIYVYRDQRLFAFASEAKALLQIPRIDDSIRLDAVKDFFFYQYVPDPKSIYARIDKIRPGHHMSLRDGVATERQYWNVSFAGSRAVTLDEAAEELRVLLRQCVADRLVSDVPLGAFLSGGIDSSAVVAMMASAGTGTMKTCSIGFDSAEHDEVVYARRVAELFQTDHTEYTVRETVSDRLLHIASFLDEPFADPSFVPTFFVSELARQQVTVALAGDGGDENFAGYSKYSVDATEQNLRRLLPPGVRGALPGLAAMARGSSLPYARRAGSLMLALSMEPDRAFFLTNSFFDQRLWNELVAGDLARETAGYDPADITRGYYAEADSDDHLSKILYTDLKSYLPGDILTKVDRMSMASSLETRAPLLDYRMVEFAAALPSRLKMQRGEKKLVLKRSLQGILPDDVLYRRKMGFSVPLAQWLRQEIREMGAEYLLAPRSGLSQLFDARRIRSLWDSHQRGQNHAAELWSLLVFELWWQNYVEGRRCAVAA